MSFESSDWALRHDHFRAEYRSAFTLSGPLDKEPPSRTVCPVRTARWSRMTLFQQGVLTVKKFLAWATAVATLAFVFAAGYSAQAQQGIQSPGARPPTQVSPAANVKRFKIAVVDISRIFNEHQGFKASIEAVKKEVEQVEATMKQDHQQLRSLQEQLNRLNPGTPDFKKIDGQISEKKAQIAVKMDKHRKEFMEKEARIYNQTFLAISGAVKQYSLHNDLALVIQLRSDNNGSPKERLQKTVMKKLQNPIVFQNRIDITNDILTMLNTRREAVRPNRTQPRPR